MAAESTAKFDALDWHVVQGDTAAYALRCCLGISPERTVTGAGDLSFGPLPAKPGPEMKQLAKGGGAIHLWLGTLLSERLFAFRLVALLKDMDVEARRIRLVDMDRIAFHEGHAPSVATLDCEQFDMLGPWRALDTRRATEFAAAWEAVSAATPQGLVDYCARKPRKADDPVQTLRAFLSRYPAADTGLPLWDRILLESCRAHGPDAARVVGHAMAHEPPYPDWPGDDTLFRRLKHMADTALPHPLVRMIGDPGSIRTARVTLTKAGERVLDGAANAIALNGIDDRVGGVRLDSAAGALWVHEGETLVPAGPDGARR